MSSNEQSKGGGPEGTPPAGDGKDIASSQASTSGPAGSEKTLASGDGDKGAANASGKRTGNGGDKSGNGGQNQVAKPPVVIRQPVYRRPGADDQPLRPHYVRPKAQLLHGSPRVLITPDAYKSMCLYVEIGPLEVGWQGTVSRTPRGDFIIEKTFLLDQDVTGVETELSVDARFKLAFELSERGDEGIDEANRMRFWGHSHVRMGTGPSRTDERTMDQFEREGCPWYVRGIFNKLGRGSFTIFLYEQGFRINDAPWAVIDPATKQVILDRPNFAGNYGGGGFGWSSGGTCWGQRKEAEQQVSGGPALPGAAAGANQTPFKKAPNWLPEILVPSAELRAQVQAEYKAKVRERRGFSAWVRGMQTNNGGANNGGANNGAPNGDDATNAAIAQMEAQYGTGAMLGANNEPAGDGKFPTQAMEPRRGMPQQPHVDANGRVDLSGTWVPTDVTSPAKPITVAQTGHYVRIELGKNNGSGRPESLTGAYLEKDFVVDGWVSVTSGEVGSMEIKVEVINPNLMKLEGADKYYSGVYRRAGNEQTGPGLGEQIVTFFKDLFSQRPTE